MIYKTLHRRVNIK